MAFPKDMEPPRTFHLSWTPQPVPLKAEERVASLVVKRGDFGWLSDERVDAIAAQVESEQMNLDQALPSGLRFSSRRPCILTTG